MADRRETAAVGSTMRPVHELPPYVVPDEPVRRRKEGPEPPTAPSESRREARGYQNLPAGGIATPIVTSRGWTGLEIIHHVVLEPLDARDRFDDWWRHGPHELSAGRSRIRLDEPRPPELALRLVRGRAYLHGLPPSIAVEMELASWGKTHAAMYLRPTNKFLIAASAMRRRTWFTVGHAVVDQIRDALLEV
jgi:hypothetical protein